MYLIGDIYFAHLFLLSFTLFEYLSLFNAKLLKNFPKIELALYRV